MAARAWGWWAKNGLPLRLVLAIAGFPTAAEMAALRQG
jgi:hypothetical protein